MELMNLQGFLTWLAGGVGSSIAVTWVFARWPWFNTLSQNVKNLLLAVSCAILALASYQIVLYVPQETIEMLSPYFAIISMAFSSFFLGNKTFASFRAGFLAAKKRNAKK